MADYSDVFVGNKISLCSDCVKEQNIDAKHIERLGWMVTNTVCMRHFAKTFKIAGFDDAKIKKIVDDQLKKAKTTPPRDLNEPENSHLVKWLKHPVPPNSNPSQ